MIARTAVGTAMAVPPEAMPQPRNPSVFPGMYISQIVPRPVLPEQPRCALVHPDMDAISTAMGMGSAANDLPTDARRSLRFRACPELSLAGPGLVLMTDEQHLWACALAVEKRYGAHAPLHVAERIGSLGHAGDEGGVAMWQAIAVRLDQLRRGHAWDEGGMDRPAFD